MTKPLALIVGSGPTGMTMAIELKRAGLDTYESLIRRIIRRSTRKRWWCKPGLWSNFSDMGLRRRPWAAAEN